MPSANRMSTPVGVDEDVIEGRYARLGDYTVGFETHKEDADPAPLFAGLPDDRCPCAHWGVVTAGRIVFRWRDHEETYVAGDAYYAPPGHLPLLSAGTSLVEFSPTAELEATMAVLERTMSSGGGRPMTTHANAVIASADPVVGRVVEKLVQYLETGSVPEDLFAPDLFTDLTLPLWRVQAGDARGLLDLRAEFHPFPGTVRVERLEATEHGFVMEFEEQWRDEGQDWYSREMLRADLHEEMISELSVYCTGDWDEERRTQHAGSVTLIRD